MTSRQIRYVIVGIFYVSAFVIAWNAFDSYKPLLVFILALFAFFIRWEQLFDFGPLITYEKNIIINFRCPDCGTTWQIKTKLASGLHKWITSNDLDCCPFCEEPEE